MFESQKIQATKGKSTAGNKIHDNNDGEEEFAALQLEGEVSLGDLIWVKLHGNSWWPALVVDENSVSVSCKPGNRSKGEVLVRLYGSYEYIYADLRKYFSEFKTILEQNNGNSYEIFDKALEQDFSRSKSIKPKGQGSKSTANKGAGASKGKKKLNQNQVKENQVDDTNPDATARKNRVAKADIGKYSKGNVLDKKGTVRHSARKRLIETNSQSSERTSPGKSPKCSARRMKVMQGLGLTAPPGSPFQKN